MRGKAPCPHIFLLTLWITPAHAGKRLFLKFFSKSARDHPRTCGEKPERGTKKNRRSGSPPHMRGKVILCTSEKIYKRITPAHAGKRTANAGLLLLLKDHPRTCGEKRQKFSVRRYNLGSPPHMRGKDTPIFLKNFKERITPAHAGKRLSSAGIIYRR